jgi:hypothetical protein
LPNVLECWYLKLVLKDVHGRKHCSGTMYWISVIVLAKGSVGNSFIYRSVGILLFDCLSR